jgi:hypothetical protein
MAVLQQVGTVAGASCAVPFAFKGYRHSHTANQALEQLGEMHVLPGAMRMDNVLLGAEGRSFKYMLDSADTRLDRRTRRFLAADRG